MKLAKNKNEPVILSHPLSKTSHPFLPEIPPIQEYINQKKEIQALLLKYFDGPCFSNENFNELIDFLKKQNILTNRDELLAIMNLILAITSYKRYNSDILYKIDHIITYLQDNIQTYFTNIKIYEIFRNCKAILRLLLNKQILKVDEKLSLELYYKKNKNGTKYRHFFYPEIKPFLTADQSKEIEEELRKIDSDIFNETSFNEKRLEGQNDFTICSLIRNDSICEFVKYLCLSNIPVSSTITPSFFETNLFLLNEKKTALIEYAAFFGSIKIFTYLTSKVTDFDKARIMKYAVYGGNIRMIQYLKNNEFFQDDSLFVKMIKKSIKTYNDDLYEYFMNNMDHHPDYDDDDKIREANESFGFKYYNFSYINYQDNEIMKYYTKACKYNHLALVKLIIKENGIDVNEVILGISTFFPHIETIEDIF